MNLVISRDFLSIFSSIVRFVETKAPILKKNAPKRSLTSDQKEPKKEPNESAEFLNTKPNFKGEKILETPTSIGIKTLVYSLTFLLNVTLNS